MNKLFNISKIFLMLAFTAFVFTSCDEDDPTVVVDDKDKDSTTVDAPNGVYLFGDASAEEFSAFYIMTDGVVEGAGNAAVPRTGLLATYVYLKVGTFVFASVEDKVRTNYGGTVETIDLAGENDQINAEILKGDWTKDGAAITIANEGLHQVIIDSQTGTFVISPVNSWGIIGDATPDSWGSDTDFSVTAEADEKKVVYTASDVAMIAGQWKIRYNDGWKIAQDSIGDIPGYKVFTNYGGSKSALLPGGANVELADADKGIYDLKLIWDAITGFSIEFTKTGDVVVEEWKASNFNFGIIGDATPGGWDADTDMTLTSVGDTHTWAITVELLAGKVFKFRPNDDWPGERNFDNLTIDGTAKDAIEKAGEADNGIRVKATEADASYDIKLVTSDKGATYSLTIDKVVVAAAQ